MSEINNTKIDNAKDIDILMPMHNVIEYSDNYSKTSGSLWEYCKDIPAVYNNNAIVNFNGANSTYSFNFKVKMTGQTGDDGTNSVKMMAPLKHLSNFWINREMTLINYEINVILTCSANCVIVYTNVANQNATFEITDIKIYVPVVTLSTEDNSKLLKQLDFGRKITNTWNKYLSKPELLPRDTNLNHLVELSFNGVNRLFVLAFQNGTHRTSAKGYYLPNIELKD